MEINEEIDIVLDKFLSGLNIQDSADIKMLFKFKEGKVKKINSYWSAAQQDISSLLEDAEYFIFEYYISPKDSDYKEFMEEEENKDFINKSFLVSRSLLFTTLSCMTPVSLFMLKENIIEDYSKEKISELADFNELMTNTKIMRDIFIASLNINLQELEEVLIESQILELMNNNYYEKVLTKVTTLFKGRLSDYHNGNRPLKFLYLLSLYIIQNNEKFVDINYKEKFTDLIIRFFNSNKNAQSKVPNYNELKQFIDYEFKNDELFFLFNISNILKEQFEKNKNTNIYLLKNKGAELDNIFEKKVIEGQRRIRK